MHQALLDLVPRTQDSAVPVRDFAEGQTGEALAALVDEQVKVPMHETDALVIACGRCGLARGLPLRKLSEDPGIEQRPAADRDARATRHTQHLLCIGDGA